MRNLKKSLGLLLVLLVASLGSSGCSRDPGAATPTQTQVKEVVLPAGVQRFELLSFVDGDTIKIRYHGKKENLRLIGIDTPETHDNERLRKMTKRTGQDKKTIIKLGERSLAYAQTLLTVSQTVPVEFDVTKRDKYDRLLGYVYLPSGELFQEVMLRNGYADLFTYPPNVKYVERLQAAFKQSHQSAEKNSTPTPSSHKKSGKQKRHR